MSFFDGNAKEDIFASYACFPHSTRGRMHKEEEAIGRSVYQRDRDRILHSGAFRKLKYKTQVFVYHEGDYYRTRLTHSIEVSQIARSLSRAIGLNEDLSEALALCHDFGHTPFGHAGEDALNLVMQPFGGFNHNDQTLRILTNLEQRYADFDGLNLTWETIEGIAKHNGPICGNYSLTLSQLDTALDLQLNLYGSLESQVAAIADDVAYNSHDVDDGLRAGIFTIQDLSEVSLIAPIVEMLLSQYKEISEGRLVNETIRRVVNTMVTDLLDETKKRLLQTKPLSSQDVRESGRELVGFSNELRDQVDELREFLFQRMYRNFKVNRMASKAKRVITALFQLFLAEPNCLPSEWQQKDKTINGDTQARQIADYIAGMTDRYALLEYERLFDFKAKI
jgi:dGTPase